MGAANEFVSKIGEEVIDTDTAIKLVKGGIVNLEFFSMVDVSDVADILEGDSEAAQKICEAAKKLLLNPMGLPLRLMTNLKSCKTLIMTLRVLNLLKRMRLIKNPRIDTG